MDSSYVTTEVMLARERTTTGRVRATVRLGPVGVVGLPVGLKVEGPSEG